MTVFAKRSYLRFSYFKPFVAPKQMRAKLARVDVAAGGAAAAQHGLPLVQSAARAEIDEICVVAAGEVEQQALGLAGKVQNELQALRLGADERDYRAPVGRCEGDVELILSRAEIAIPQAGVELDEALKAKRRFCAVHGLAQEPSFKASLVRWSGVGAFIAIVETACTASGYAHAVGWIEGGFYALLACVGVVLASLGLSSGILLAKHQRNLVAKLAGPLVAAASTSALVFVALAASHFRHVVGAAPDTAAQAAAAVWESILADPLLPLGALPNLGLFSVALMSGIGLCYETVLTWGYWGWRGHAMRVHTADRKFKRSLRTLVTDVERTGEREKRAVARQAKAIKSKVGVATGLSSVLIAIASAHATSDLTIRAEHKRAVASLEEHYRLALAPLERERVAVTRGAGFAETRLALPSTFQAAAIALDAEVNQAIGAVPEAIAAIDATVAAAIARLRVLAEGELARVAGAALRAAAPPLLPQGDA